MIKAALAAAVLSILASSVRADPYVVCDNGLRCIMAPCPSMNAVNLRSGKVARITGVDLDALPPEERDRLGEAEATYRGTVVLEGSVRTRRAGVRPAPILLARKTLRRVTSSERRLCGAG